MPFLGLGGLIGQGRIGKTLQNGVFAGGGTRDGGGGGLARRGVVDGWEEDGGARLREVRRAPLLGKGFWGNGDLLDWFGFVYVVLERKLEEVGTICGGRGELRWRGVCYSWLFFDISDATSNLRNRVGSSVTCLGFWVAIRRFIFVVDRKSVEARFEESDGHPKGQLSSWRALCMRGENDFTGTYEG